MGLTLSSAIQYANDCLARGWDPDTFLPRFTFFFDISISFFEESTIGNICLAGFGKLLYMPLDRKSVV